jgi:hypothetical protein
LDLLARRRGEAAYLPGGALLLLPAPLLAAASLAAGFEAPLQVGPGAVGVPTANECVTVAFRFAGGENDASGLPAGALVGAWLFESVVGPVQSLTFDTADAALATAAAAAARDVADVPPPLPAAVPTDAAAAVPTDAPAAAAAMTVAELRLALAAQGLPKTGLKATLVERWAAAASAASAAADTAAAAASADAASSGPGGSGGGLGVDAALEAAAAARDPAVATLCAVAAAQPWLANALSRYYIGTQRKKPAVLLLRTPGASNGSGYSGGNSGSSGVVGASASATSLDLCLRLFSEEALRAMRRRGVAVPRLADAAATRFLSRKEKQ